MNETVGSSHVSKPIQIEICVDCFESIQEAYIGGADRIELCSSLKEGGLTPSYGFLRLAKQKFPNLQVYPMIRSRGGDFCYSSEELEIMAQDIECFKALGADGFVFGCLKSDRSLDLEANRNLLKIASPLPCTFHRAFDLTENFRKSLEDCIELGFKRILTSGHCKRAIDGLDQILEMINIANNRIIIMPGAGITVDNISKIVGTKKIQEFHCSASRTRLSEMQTNDFNRITMGSNSDELEWKIADQIKIKQMRLITNQNLECE
ncbi:copper homeostasis protein cutC-like protein [Sarcoptes scabiei]|uniref:Copper homeostasis protein cutC homolog n=1 Tax=Sarcoptes scabiei TaxID=52283 RepID=A0A131ZYV2_SARSC|nr:copper homeostasis protein cutC-like protein [Sarcoptes scabiei]